MGDDAGYLRAPFVVFMRLFGDFGDRLSFAKCL